VSTGAFVTPARAKKPRADLDRARIVWSNVNVGEALPGVATPLTWSVLSNFSDLGFRRAFGAVGCKVPRDAELVGNFRGRIYLNLTEFVSIASQVPGLKPRTLMALGGGGEVERLEAQLASQSSAGFFLRLPVTVTRFVRENYRLTARVEEFERFIEEERERYRAMDLRILAPSALSKTLRDLEQLLDYAGAVMLNCYGNLLMSVVALRVVLDVVARRQSERIERALLTGLADVESAAPGLALWHIAEMARADEPARALILAREPASLRVETLPDGPTRRALENYLAAYGFRGAREAEIATPRWREDPSLLFATLRAQLARGDTRERPVDVERRQRAIRDAAQAELDRLLPAPARAAVRHLLSLVQRFARLRERLRAHVTEVLGMFREVALDASRRVRAQEPQADDDAAFFLTLEELHAVLAGDVRSVAPLVRQRRQQYERDRALPDPPDTFVGYPPAVQAPLPDTNALHGLAASSGRVEGRARVLSSPNDAKDLEAGEILVAPYADVGWSPLFTVAAAVVTDLGGPLSHASVVAREYGVPSVVNVKIGTRVIKNGDLLRVDGDAGTVEILASSE
jgi:pyruvate,water dikinase